MTKVNVEMTVDRAAARLLQGLGQEAITSFLALDLEAKIVGLATFAGLVHNEKAVQIALSLLGQVRTSA